MEHGPLPEEPPATPALPSTPQPSWLLLMPSQRVVLAWVGVAALLFVLFLLRRVATLALLSFGLSYVLRPTVGRLERFGIRRTAAIFLVVLGSAAAVSALVAVLVPELLRQLEAIVDNAPQYSNEIQRTWIPWLRSKLHMRLPPRTEDALEQLGFRVSAIGPRLTGLVNDTVAFTFTVIEAFATALLTGVLTFYFLHDYDHVIEGARELVPQHARPRVFALADEIDDTLRHFVHGQLLSMAILGALFSLGLGALGVPAGWAIGLIAGMISFVPYLGFLVALVLALLMTALEGGGLVRFVQVCIFMLVVHGLDLGFITPRILGGQARLPPVVVLLALLAGGTLGGAVGVLLAIPAASVGRILLRELLHLYRESDFFRGTAANTASPSIATDTDDLRDSG